MRRNYIAVEDSSLGFEMGLPAPRETIAVEEVAEVGHYSGPNISSAELPAGSGPVIALGMLATVIYIADRYNKFKEKQNPEV